MCMRPRGSGAEDAETLPENIFTLLKFLHILFQKCMHETRHDRCQWVLLETNLFAAKEVSYFFNGSKESNEAWFTSKLFTSVF